jgi:hypothetical protein
LLSLIVLSSIFLYLAEKAENNHDRSGYLRTPIGNKGSPAAQADLAATLLDSLGANQQRS